MKTIQRQLIYKGGVSRIVIEGITVEIRVIDDHAVVKIFKEDKNVS